MALRVWCGYGRTCSAVVAWHLPVRHRYLTEGRSARWQQAKVKRKGKGLTVT